MTMLVIGLYDQSGEAKRAIEALEDEGFGRSDIELIQGQRRRKSKGFFKSLFRMGGSDGLEPEDLMEKGISEEDAQFYTNAVHDGRSLVIVRCATDRTGRAHDILARFRLSQYGMRPKTEEVRREETRPESAHFDPQEEFPGTMPGEPFRGEEEMYTGPRYAEGEDEIRAREELQDREREEIIEREERVRTYPMTEVHPPGTGQEELRVQTAGEGEDLYRMASRKSPYFDENRPEFRRHYDEHFADEDYGFQEYSQAYRYGLALADHEPFFTLKWEDIAEHASRSWEEYNKGTWHRFRQAVRFGWDRLRQRAGIEEEERPGGRL